MNSLRILVATVLVGALISAAVSGESTPVFKWNPKTEKFELPANFTNAFKRGPNTEKLDLAAKLHQDMGELRMSPEERGVGVVS
jgi:hypothetical protein